MGTGDKEVRQAFEEVTRKNVKANVQFSNETRSIVREMEKKILDLQNIILSRNTEVDMIKKQLALMQQVVFSGGTTTT